MAITDFFYDLSFASLQIAVSIMQALGPIGFFIVMIVQAVIVFIPSEAVLILGGTTYGLLWGSIIGGFGALGGAVVAFYLSKKLGRPIAEKLIGKTWLTFADKWFDKYGGWAVLIGRVLPFIPFDAISYGAGLTKIDFKTYFIATFIGSFPRAIFYSFLGVVIPTEREGMESLFTLAIGAIGAILIAVVVLQHYMKKKMVDGEANVERRGK
jgi:uncharacterized membrane protein YdjX (TVP38/TMEM64 family)